MEQEKATSVRDSFHSSFIIPNLNGPMEKKCATATIIAHSQVNSQSACKVRLKIKNMLIGAHSWSGRALGLQREYDPTIGDRVESNINVCADHWKLSTFLYWYTTSECARRVSASYRIAPWRDSKIGVERKRKHRCLRWITRNDSIRQNLLCSTSL